MGGAAPVWRRARCSVTCPSRIRLAASRSCRHSRSATQRANSVLHRCHGGTGEPAVGGERHEPPAVGQAYRALGQGLARNRYVRRDRRRALSLRCQDTCAQAGRCAGFARAHRAAGFVKDAPVNSCTLRILRAWTRRPAPRTAAVRRGRYRLHRAERVSLLCLAGVGDGGARLVDRGELAKPCSSRPASTSCSRRRSATRAANNSCVPRGPERFVAENSLRCFGRFARFAQVLHRTNGTGKTMTAGVLPTSRR